MRYALVAVLLLYWCISLASSVAPAHEMGGIDYSKWLMPSPEPGSHRGYSCCNDIDCAPRPSRFKDGGWQVFWVDGNRWVKVPDQKVEQNYSDEWNPGDHMGHACIGKTGNVYCFRAGEDLN